jgi:hypothetical protein
MGLCAVHDTSADGRAWRAGSKRTAGRCECSSTPRGSASKKAWCRREHDRPDIARKRQRWKTHQDRIAARRLVFVDETWRPTWLRCAAGDDAARRAWQSSYGQWETLTFIACLRHDRTDAPFVIDGPINGEPFTFYVVMVLAPTLNEGDDCRQSRLPPRKSRTCCHPQSARTSALPAAL